MMPDPPPQPLLVFRRIGPFAVNKSVLTPQLKQQVTQVVDFVKVAIEYGRKPIGVIRIVGHTDGSGTEVHNIGLGNRRMEAVREELHAQLGDLIRRVLIDVEESPGKSKPIGDNRTAKGPGGESTRRRVCRTADSEGRALDETATTGRRRPLRLILPRIRSAWIATSRPVGGQVRAPVPDGSLRASIQEAGPLQDARRQSDLRRMQGHRGCSSEADRSDDFRTSRRKSIEAPMQRGG